MKRKPLCLSLALALSFGLAACQSSPDTSSAQSSVVSDSSSAKGCAPDEFGCEVSSEKSSEEIVKREEYDQTVASFREISFDDAIHLFEDKGTGLVYFGFPDCPWCNEIVPLLKGAAEEADIEVLYVRTRDDDHERLYSDEQRDKIAPYFGDHDYIRNNLMGQPTMYVPLVIAVKDGELAAGHQGTVDGHDAKESEMTDEQREQAEKEIAELVNTLKK